MQFHLKIAPHISYIFGVTLFTLNFWSQKTMISSIKYFIWLFCNSTNCPHIFYCDGLYLNIKYVPVPISSIAVYTWVELLENQCQLEVEKKSGPDLSTGQRCIVGYWLVTIVEKMRGENTSAWILLTKVVQPCTLFKWTDTLLFSERKFIFTVIYEIS